jgi:hypothetical protein
LSKHILILAGAGYLAAAAALAQHEGHGPPPTPTPAAPAEHAHETEQEGAPVIHHGAAGSDRNLFESDMLLMTGMVPEDPMAGAKMPKWHVMDLGVARLLFNGQSGPSGRKGAESSNWNMLHAQHDLWGGRLSLMLMNSLEPATFPAAGSPELFQTGETYQGKALVDRQHPHDFFMNLSATWRRQLGERSALWVQLAPVGDPALGPTAFMHRASAGENPTAPLGHHWEDSTHISYDVITAGFGWKAVSIEGSVFHGAEPDENRWGIESGALDSASGRIWLRFRDGWSGQVSYGFLKNPEALEPGDLHRVTASISYGAAGDRPFAATLIWGRNDEEHGITNAWLLEAAWQITPVDQVYGRTEYAQKDYDLLAFKGEPHEEQPGEPEIADVFQFTAGYLRDFELVKGLKTGLGADLTLYSFPSSLKPVYGSFPVSGHFFVRLRWGSPHGAGHSM